MNTHLRTGSDPLDNQLGGLGFPHGSSVVIQGKPGTGKTTLALQIGKHAIDHEGHSFVYAAVEKPPGLLLDQITASFWDTDHATYLGDAGPWAVADLTRYWDEVASLECVDGMVTDVVEYYLDQEDQKADAAEVRRGVEWVMREQPGAARPGGDPRADARDGTGPAPRPVLGVHPA